MGPTSNASRVENPPGDQHLWQMFNAQSISQCHRNHPDYNHDALYLTGAIRHARRFHYHHLFVEMMGLSAPARIRRLRRLDSQTAGMKADGIARCSSDHCWRMLAGFGRCSAVAPGQQSAGLPGSWPA